MINFLYDQISLHALIWLLPVAFFIHDGEEIITLEKWLRNHQNHSRIASLNRLLDPNKNIKLQFTTAVLLLGLVLSLIAYGSASNFEYGSRLNMLFAGVFAVILLDGVKHVMFTVLLRGYSPGVITAIVVEIPFAAYALYRFYDAGDISAASIAGGLVMALPLTVFLIWCSFKLGKWIIPFRE